MIRHTLATRLAAAVLVAVAMSSAQAATFDLVLSPGDGGWTQMAFQASGHVDQLAGASDLTWSNLSGGNPFQDALQFFAVDVEPIATTSGIQFIGLTFDSDGEAVGQDDLTLRFDDLVFSDDDLGTAWSIRPLALDFALLNPGVYTRSTSAGNLTLTILASPVPWPASAHLLLGGLVCLAAARRGAMRRHGA